MQGSMRSLLTLDEAAGYLTVSPRFMRRLVFERRIGFVKVGRFIRFERESLDAFLAAGRVPPSDSSYSGVA